jgi:hypothetical protein
LAFDGRGSHVVEGLGRLCLITKVDVGPKVEFLPQKSFAIHRHWLGAIYQPQFLGLFCN